MKHGKYYTGGENNILVNISPFKIVYLTLITSFSQTVN